MKLLIDPPRRGGGSGPAIAISLVLHAALLIFFIRSVKPIEEAKTDVPMARYVELIRQQPKQFTEAPGQAVESAPLNAPFSDANRKASMPNPTGDQPTTRPGDGSAIYTPDMSSGEGRRPQPAQQQQIPQPRGGAQQQPQGISPQYPAGGELRAPSPSYVDGVAPSSVAAASAAQSVNWRTAIREIRGAGSGGAEGFDLSGVGGGEKGSAEAGPLSFETQWYDWGEYAQSMVSKIRVHWYQNMPQIIRTGVKGVVTIRFTIQRDGRITNIEQLESSGVPPYDFAARKAIELSSPLKALPKDFPNDSERVTCMFYYNQSVPVRGR
jgi:TonB family protein